MDLLNPRGNVGRGPFVDTTILGLWVPAGLLILLRTSPDAQKQIRKRPWAARSVCPRPSGSQPWS